MSDSPFDAVAPWSPGDDDDRELSAFVIQDHEGRCGECHTVHPIGSECW